MPDVKTIRELVESAIAEAFDSHVRALHDEVVGRVLDTVQAIIPAAPETSVSESLKRAILAVESASQQTDILKALLDGSAHFSARSALFVLRGSAAVGWHARGFRDNEAVRTMTINTVSTMAGAAVHQRSVVTGPITQFDAHFAKTLGAPGDGSCMLAPLIIRDRVAALLYADGGIEGGVVDSPALEILTRAAGLWIETNAFRKASAPAVSPRVAEVQAKTAAPVQANAAPQAAPVGAKVTAGPGVHAGTSEPVKTDSIAAQVSEPASPTAVVTAVEVAKTDMPAAVEAQGGQNDVSAEEQETHKKARRFAKLLVDEIVLYNREKVVEGRVRHDLYERLKEDIEKSRATYQRRYGQTSAAHQDYFTQALISGLADHNPSLLGPNFERAS
ncbi:MAG TPA: hypothetical protein VFM10_08125 [Terriglobales bacterium]|nr:hypothetical protein [Terriglobales bacterium]